jgi:hypothetical protein
MSIERQDLRGWDSILRDKLHLPEEFSWPGESIHSPAEIATHLERIGIDLKA